MLQFTTSLRSVVRRHVPDTPREAVIAPDRNFHFDTYKTTSNLSILHAKPRTQPKLRMLQPNTSLPMVIRRNAPELIPPAVPIPRELKPLSDIDDQEAFRYHFPGILICERDPKKEDTNPASVIREALAKLLVFYYPFAGRLKEGPAKKLMVDCTGEGVLFIEAEADVTLKQLGEVLHPPFPCIEELLYDVPDSGGIVDSPLLFIQVTRLLCGGFVLAWRFNHTMCDGTGFYQFLIALGEIARGKSTPSKLPVWQRELLFARDTPRVTFNHPEYNEMTNTKHHLIATTGKMHQKSFFFGSTELSAIRRFVPENLKGCSNYEMLAASFWRCRTIALDPDPEEEMRFMYAVNARTILKPSLPVGYYGNCFVTTCAITTAQDLTHKPLGHALELVMKAKTLVSEEYVRSTADLMVMIGRPMLNVDHRTYMMSDLSRLKAAFIDFGLGKPVYAGPATGGEDFIPGVLSYYMSSANKKGESGFRVPISLPSTAAMEKFVKELDNMLM